MCKLVIRKDEDTLYQILKENIQELRHNPEEVVEGFAVCPTLNIADIYKPTYHKEEQWYVIMRSGNRIDLTEEQYNVIKEWFDKE